jgi:hypothetical protein
MVVRTAAEHEPTYRSVFVDLVVEQVVTLQAGSAYDVLADVVYHRSDPSAIFDMAGPSAYLVSATEAPRSSSASMGITSAGTHNRIFVE